MTFVPEVQRKKKEDKTKTIGAGVTDVVKAKFKKFKKQKIKNHEKQASSKDLKFQEWREALDSRTI